MDNIVVEALCIADAYGSRQSIQYNRNQTYQLDLSNPEHRKLVYLQTPKKEWIFQFDRSLASDPNASIFFCKECGEPFETFMALGTHSRSVHKQAEVFLTDDEPAVIVKDGRGKKKVSEGRTYTCKDCGEVLPHPYALRVHKKEKHSEATVELQPDANSQPSVG